MNYINDEELLYLSRQGCSVATEYLLDYYYIYCRKIIYGMFGRDNLVDKQDYLQSTMVEIWKIFDSYRSDRNCSLKTYITISIKNFVITKFKRSYKKERKAYYYAISLDEECYGGGHYDEIVEDQSHWFAPQETCVLREQIAYYNQESKGVLSPLEKQILDYRVLGYRVEEIARILSIDTKAVYNAVYRISKKLKRLEII